MMKTNETNATIERALARRRAAKEKLLKRPEEQRRKRNDRLQREHNRRL